MTGIAHIVREEPTGPNTSIIAWNEERQRLSLTDFVIESTCRYSFVWNRGDSLFPTQSISLINKIVSIGDGHFVVGWKCRSDGYGRARYRSLQHYLRKCGWNVHTEDTFGLAVTEISEGKISELIEVAETWRLGWFVGIGPWCTSDVLSSAPFRSTIISFSLTHRFAPSAQFLKAMGNSNGSSIYRVSGDAVAPAVILVTGANANLTQVVAEVEAEVFSAQSGASG